MPKKVTPATQWRQTTQIVELPSGKVAEMKRINVLAMIRKSSNVPNFLLEKIQAELNGAMPKKNDDRNTEEEMNDMIESIFFLARSAFVYPKLVDGEPQAEDEVCIDDVDMADLAYAAEYATGDAAAIATVAEFREKSESDVEPVPAGD